VQRPGVPVPSPAGAGLPHSGNICSMGWLDDLLRKGIAFS
jgi:hypothetical protein